MTDDEENPWADGTRANAVEYLDLEIYRREYFAKGSGCPLDETEVVVTLPLIIARLVLAAARAGMRKGQGRKGVRLTHAKREDRKTLIYWAKARKAELIAEGMKPGKAEEQAAEEQRALAWKRYGINLAKSTIKRAIRSRT